MLIPIEFVSYISGMLTSILAFISKENLAIAGGILAILKWLYETHESRVWETNKYLMEKLKEFQDQPSTKLVHKILDYNGQIPFEVKNIKTLINDNDVCEALITHDVKENFTELEYEIRNTFDDYFDHLTELILLCECKLIDEENTRFLLSYYINILNGKSKSKSKEYVKQIKTYLTFYKYNLVLEFIYKN